MKKILVIVLSLFASGACAQWQVPNHSVPIGRGSGSGFKNVPPANTRSFLGGAGASADPTMRELVPSDLPSPPSIISATATGSAAIGTITLVPSYIPTGVTTLQNGMTFNFISPFSSTTAAFVNISIASLGATTINLFQPDGYTWTYVGDIQLGQPITIQYVSGVGFVTRYPNSPTANGSITAIPNGSVTLAPSNSTVLSLGGSVGGPGSAMLQWNSTAGQYRLTRVTQGAAYSQDLFNSTANVEGVVNQTLANNTLYGVFLNPQVGLGYTAVSPAAPGMSFWRFNQGYYHGASTNGIEVLCQSGTCDERYPYLGSVYTYNADITTYIAPEDAPMRSSSYSHYNAGREKFGYQTLPHSNTTTSTTYAVQTLPSVGSVTGALNAGPSFLALTIVSCTTDARTVSTQLSLSGEGYVSGSGGTFTVVSQEASVYLPLATKTAQLVNYFETAPADGTMTAQIAVKVSGGTCTFVTTITGSIPQ